MKKEVIFLSIILTASSVFMNLSVLSARNFIDNDYYAGKYYDKINADEISIFPNPVFNDKLTIDAEKPFFMVEILNIVGSSVLLQEYNLGVYKVVLNLEKLDKGIYIIKVKFETNNIITEKITVK